MRPPARDGSQQPAEEAPAVDVTTAVRRDDLATDPSATLVTRATGDEQMQYLISVIDDRGEQPVLTDLAR